MTPKWKQIVPALLVGILLGLWAGALLPKAALWCRHQRGSDADRLLNTIGAELKLDAGQKDAVKAVLETYRSQTKALHQETTAKFTQIRASMRQDVDKLLNPEQQKKFQEIQSHWDARRQRQ